MAKDKRKTTAKAELVSTANGSQSCSRPSLERLKTLEEDFSTFYEQTEELRTILGDEILPEGPNTPSVSRRSAFLGRRAWALRWILKRLHEDKTRHVTHTEEAWDLLRGIVSTLPLAISARVLSTGHLLESVAAALPQHALPPPTRATQTSEVPSGKKRKYEDQEQGTLKKLRTSKDTAAPKSADDPSWTHVRALTACLNTLTSAASGTLPDVIGIHAEHIKAVLTAPEELAARLLRGWFIAAGRDGELALSLQPYLFIWNNRQTNLDAPASASSQCFASQCLLPAIAYLTQGSLVPHHQALATKKLIAKHLLLPARASFLNGAPSSGSTSLRALLTLADDRSGQRRQDQASKLLFDLCLSCSKRANGKLLAKENKWLEHALCQICIYARLMDANDGRFNLSSSSPDRQWTELGDMLRLAVKHNVSLSQDLLERLLIDACGTYDDRLSQKSCQIAALVIQLDASLFTPSAKEPSKALSVLEGMLQMISGLLCTDFYTGRPSLTNDPDEQQDRPYIIAPEITSKAVDELYFLAVNGVLVPLFRAFVAARHLNKFLDLWKAGLVEAYEMANTATPVLSIWEDATMVEEFEKHAMATFTPRELCETLDATVTSLNDYSSLELSCTLDSRVVMATTILRSITSMNTLQSISSSGQTLHAKVLDVLQAIDARRVQTMTKLTFLAGVLCSRSPYLDKDQTQLSETLAALQRILEQPRKTTKASSKLSRPDREDRRPLTAAALSSLNVVTIRLMQLRPRTDQADERSAQQLTEAFTVAFNPELWRAASSPGAEWLYSELTSSTCALLSKGLRSKQGESACEGLLGTTTNFSDMDCINEQLHRYERCLQGLAGLGDSSLASFIGVLEHISEGAAHPRKHPLLYHRLPMKHVPRRFREKLLDMLVEENDLNKLDRAECICRLGLIMKLLNEPFGKAKIATNVWLLLDKIYDPESPCMPTLARDTCWRGIAARIILLVVQEQPRQPQCSNKDKRSFWSKVYPKEGNCYLEYTNEDELRQLRSSLHLDDSGSPQADDDSGALRPLQSSAASSWQCRVQIAKPFLQTASKQTEDGRDGFLSECVAKLSQGDDVDNVCLSLATIYSNEELGKSWAASKHASALASLLCQRCSAAGSVDEFGYASVGLRHLLAQSGGRVTQQAVEETLQTVWTVASPSGPRLPAEMATVIFSSLTKLMHVLLTSHRRHLDGRFHLVLRALQSLLRCFFIPDAAGGSKTRMRAASWTVASSEQGSGSRALSSDQAEGFVRLVTLITEPSASATRLRSSKQQSLVDEIAQAKRKAGKHMGYVVAEWAECNLHGRLAGEGVREALMPGLWSVLGCVPKDTLQALADGMRSEAKSIVKALVVEWARVGGGRA